jgi:hypothetical protein
MEKRGASHSMRMRLIALCFGVAMDANQSPVAPEEYKPGAGRKA